MNQFKVNRSQASLLDGAYTIEGVYACAFAEQMKPSIFVVVVCLCVCARASRVLFVMSFVSKANISICNSSYFFP